MENTQKSVVINRLGKGFQAYESGRYTARFDDDIDKLKTYYSDQGINVTVDLSPRRDHYGALILESLSPQTTRQIHNLVNAAAKADKVDEHGNWDFGFEFDNKKRGWALNWDCYGFGKDIHTKKFLAVIQIRQYIKRSKNGYPNIRKSYFLLGRNEDNSVFAHPVESRVIHNAIRKGQDVVKSVQDWIFGCDYAKVIRQGDMALVPVKRPMGEVETMDTIILEGSHVMLADEIRRNGGFYALNPRMEHIPGTHPTVEGEGWFKVIVGKRSTFWSFAAPTID
jgi:hypothetical protein